LLLEEASEPHRATSDTVLLRGIINCGRLEHRYVDLGHTKRCFLSELLNHAVNRGSQISL
ncbi:MAG TPA: hypothetical protein VK973_17145, partial [Arenicellales bacterium]|nr:hypothetical protein [Arenicellales bacterium]